MQTWHLVIGPDGQVRIPDGKPGQTVVVVVESTPSAIQTREPLTLATARTPEERAEVINELKHLAEQIRKNLKDGEMFTVEDLYGEDGLPA